MATQINMPKLGLSMKEGVVGKWLKKEGDRLKQGEAVVEIMTDKINNVVESPVDGVLLKIIAEPDTKLLIGEVMGIIGAPGEDVGTFLAPEPVSQEPVARTIAVQAAEVPAGAISAGAERIKISPIARKLAQEHGIDYTLLAKNNPESRIMKEDIEAAIAARETAKSVLAPTSAEEPSTLEVIPYEGMQRVIGENMAKSWAIAPKVTHHVSVDLSQFVALRTNINSDLAANDKISFTDLLVKAVAMAVKSKPRMNVSLCDRQIKVWRDINIGVAVALPEGLVVPVVRNADQKTVLEISKEIKDLAQRAKQNKLQMEEMSGGSFTVTNLGAYGSVDYFTPVINQPESAILGIGRILKMPVVVDDQVVIRPMIGLSLAYDHRIINGAPAAEFMAVLMKLIEAPYKMFV
ncbi:MAG: acoC [Firmicutes bacterium]|nr:acoC [Bacillota bacterium]